ncbi:MULTISPECIES: DUF58 domain-containing protein [unclassified Colwellia]|uniref:DUF58 domain-containing protein n=1 Tax=unclassified Colwellia TaxID=196834 RepID=UPI0015F4F5D7|nr:MULTISPECIES: DUF58 domain-containing protein [unclassified Colwellia]MBA6379123.1 DUF58 domain-containing protein [Colwellia sp. BRX10-7]MBA6388853.1 DUF58 domain-containing protein [Colwellia sp. BRX10-2]MBA6403657.1 DUF58 domain-containing protein [Colwellia sp. BRX10-5]MBA6407399.1 DUF58 domain-containing protein [Colwellia sp. BRX10-1]
MTLTINSVSSIIETTVKKLAIPIKNYLSRFANKQFNRWLKRRIPPARKHKLSNHNIFIMPSRFGVVYLFFVVLLFLLATNYQNNVIMLLSYLMASVFITTMMHSFFNLSGLAISADKTALGYANQNIHFPIKISSANKRLAINFCFDDQAVLHLPQSEPGEQTVYVCCSYTNRGVYTPGRLKVSSEYSLGLFITWTRIDFDQQCIVYPQAMSLSYRQSDFGDAEQENVFSQSSKPGVDDFYELKAYLPGEPLSRLAWKQFARGQGRLTKHYHQQQGTRCWLKLNDMPNHGLEKQLAYLCFLVSEYHRSEQVFGLDLVVEKIQPSQGEFHFKECLMALAIYPKSPR